MSKYQTIFTKLGMCIAQRCIDIVDIWFGIANSQMSTKLSARHTTAFSFPDNNE